MKNEKQENTRLKEFFSKIIENWPAKIICVLLAVLLYVICQISTLDRRTFSIPLEVRNSGNLIYTNTLPKNIRVTVRGESNEVGLLQEKDFTAFVETGSYVNEGTYKVPIHLALSENATMIEPLEVQISPENISMKFDKKVTDLKPIKINLSGNCAKGYEVTELSIEPDLVQISGASAQVRGMKNLETNVINIEGKNSTIVQKVKILNLNPLLQVTGNTDFTAKVTIEPIRETRVFESNTISFLGLTSALAAENAEQNVKISLTANQNDFEKFALDERTFFVDCSDIFEKGEYELDLKYMVPEEFKVEKVEPEKVKIKFVKASQLKKTDSETETETENSAEQNLENAISEEGENGTEE